MGRLAVVLGFNHTAADLGPERVVELMGQLKSYIEWQGGSDVRVRHFTATPEEESSCTGRAFPGSDELPDPAVDGGA